MFNFWDIVVIDKQYIGVIVKCWWKSNIWTLPNYDVYVRSSNGIKNFTEENIQQYIYDKEIDEEHLFIYQ